MKVTVCTNPIHLEHNSTGLDANNICCAQRVSWWELQTAFLRTGGNQLTERSKDLAARTSKRVFCSYKDGIAYTQLFANGVLTNPFLTFFLARELGQFSTVRPKHSFRVSLPLGKHPLRLPSSLWEKEVDVSLVVESYVLECSSVVEIRDRFFI